MTQKGSAGAKVRKNLDHVTGAWKQISNQVVTSIDLENRQDREYAHFSTGSLVRSNLQLLETVV